MDNVYIYVSEIDKYSCIYNLKLMENIKINGDYNVASAIKLGDNIEFKNNINQIVLLTVKYKEYSKFPASCIDEDCLVYTDKGRMKVIDLYVGDKILTSTGLYSSIKYILVTKINNQMDMMIHPNGLIITEYHPVKINNNWCFPINIDIFEKKTIYIDNVYSIGLEDYSSFIVNDIEVIGLNHRIINDPIASHPYFGTEKVIQDILKLSSNGYCIIDPEQITRDSKTHLVNGIIDNIYH